MRGSDTITDSMDMNLSKLEDILKDRKAWRATVHGITEFNTTQQLNNSKPTRTQCIAQGALLNVLWQPGWEGSLGENGYMYMYG